MSPRTWAVASCLVLLPRVIAVEQSVAVGLLSDLSELRAESQTTNDDYMYPDCDECLAQTDCIWPCELACIIDAPIDLIGKTCKKCLDYFSCPACASFCPQPVTDAPTSKPTSKPTPYPTSKPTLKPTTGPTAWIDGPTAARFRPTMPPTMPPTSEPTAGPTLRPTTPVPSAEPSASPTAVPFPKPTRSPTSEPTASPTSAPTLYPTYAPTGVPLPSPTAAPVPKPTILPTIWPTSKPTIVPNFWVYYSLGTGELYEYNPATHHTEFMMRDDFSGDLKVDSVNSYIFWSSPEHGRVKKYDMTRRKVSTLVTQVYGVQGLAVDESRQQLYMASPNDKAILVTNYHGKSSDPTVAHDLSKEHLTPYGLHALPSAKKASFNDEADQAGMLYFTATDEKNGYIYQAEMFSENREAVYKTTSLDLHGIYVDELNEEMYWVENHGVANGLWSSDWDGENAMYVTYLKDSYWVTGLSTQGLIYTADTTDGKVYEMVVDSTAGKITSSSVMAYAEDTRCLAFYYGVDETVEISSDLPLGPTSRKDAIGKGSKTSSSSATELSESGSSAGTTKLASSATGVSLLALVAGTVAAVVFVRRRGATGYSSIEDDDMSI